MKNREDEKQPSGKTNASLLPLGISLVAVGTALWGITDMTWLPLLLEVSGGILLVSYLIPKLKRSTFTD